MSQDPTSGWSYKDIQASGFLGDKQLDVMAAIAGYYPASVTRRQVMEWIKQNINPDATDETNSYRPRFRELVMQGFAQKTGTVWDEVTRKTVRTWRWTGRKEPLKSKIVEKCCPRCKGTGKINTEEFGGENQNE